MRQGDQCRHAGLVSQGVGAGLSCAHRRVRGEGHRSDTDRYRRQVQAASLPRGGREGRVEVDGGTEAMTPTTAEVLEALGVAIRIATLDHATIEEAVDAVPILSAHRDRLEREPAVVGGAKEGTHK